ncbi:MAG: PASTA domain-containing protein [Microscillaceae bacterium]|nr:PASTA domain-containing protein [Microscillaceae bacterium]MDW8460198.1 PASTA domain-containing protein [Cytophagales bacterium]
MRKKIVIIKTDSWTDVAIHLGIVICLSIMLFIFFFANYLPYITNHGESVVVPDLRGLELEKAIELLESKDLEYAIKDSVYSKHHKPNTVLSQFPEAGSRIKQSRKIYIVINPLVPPKIPMPKLVGLSFEIALLELKNKDLELGKIRYVPHISSNTVLEQWLNGQKINPGQPVMKGTKIDLILSDGVGQTEFDVPELVGLHLSEAETVIRGSDLEVGNIQYDNTSDEPPGTVIRQNPEPYIGTQTEDDTEDRVRNKIKTGQMIDLWVSGTPVPKPRKNIFFGDEEIDNKPIKDTFRKGQVRKSSDIERIRKKRMGIKEDKEKKQNTRNSPNNELNKENEKIEAEK